MCGDDSLNAGITAFFNGKNTKKLTIQKKKRPETCAYIHFGYKNTLFQDVPRI
jgi:hypothetical protein